MANRPHEQRNQVIEQINQVKEQLNQVQGVGRIMRNEAIDEERSREEFLAIKWEGKTNGKERLWLIILFNKLYPLFLTGARLPTL